MQQAPSMLDSSALDVAPSRRRWASSGRSLAVCKRDQQALEAQLRDELRMLRACWGCALAKTLAGLGSAGKKACAGRCAKNDSSSTDRKAKESRRDGHVLGKFGHQDDVLRSFVSGDFSEVVMGRDLLCIFRRFIPLGS